MGGSKQRIETNVFAVGAGPGRTVFSKSGFAVEAIFKYNYANSKFGTTNGGVTTSTKTNTHQYAMALGIQYYFGGFRRIEV